jgi:hypothetical protein
VRGSLHHEAGSWSSPARTRRPPARGPMITRRSVGSPPTPARCGRRCRRTRRG